MEKNILKTLEDIKKLLILQLLSDNVSDKAIAQVLGIDSSTIRHIVSVKMARNNKKK